MQRTRHEVHAQALLCPTPSSFDASRTLLRRRFPLVGINGEVIRLRTAFPFLYGPYVQHHTPTHQKKQTRAQKCCLNPGSERTQERDLRYENEIDGKGDEQKQGPGGVVCGGFHVSVTQPIHAYIMYNADT